MMFLYNQSKSLEATEYEGRTSDYLFFILFNALLLLPVGYLMNFAVLGRSLVMSIIYMWSRKFPTAQMSFYFGIQFQGVYLPWVLCGFELLLGGVPMQYFAGIFTAHVFYYLTEVMPRVSGKPTFLRTPLFLYRLLPAHYNSRIGVQYAQQRDRAQHRWGDGQQLR
jgi:Derlin-2/3